MTEEQYHRASKIKEKRRSLRNELKIWQTELTSPRRLAYKQSWNSDHATDLESNISDKLFEGFREAAINDLKVKIDEIEKEFEGL